MTFPVGFQPDERFKHWRHLSPTKVHFWFSYTAFIKNVSIISISDFFSNEMNIFAVSMC